MKLSAMPVKRCSTVAAWGVMDNKILLVKHKKLGIWLAPGGHIEPDELPHHAAEREFFEETGMKADVVSAQPMLQDHNSEFLPLPFACNLHTINKPRGNEFCEQHYVFLYYVMITDTSGFAHQQEEVDDIGWFGKNDIASLETSQDIKQEALFVLQHFPKK